MSLNINGSSDPSYRYKMPPIQSTIIKSNGGDTIINNLQVNHSIINFDTNIYGNGIILQLNVFHIWQ